MKIVVDYESSWRNSFLKGSNNEPMPQYGRKFIGSITELKKPENYLERSITIDTVMGILNRLIGDQRKLYQARQNDNYFFKDLESNISFIEKPSCISEEIVYIRNITGNTDQNSYTGMIKVSDPIFTSDYSNEFWGVLALDLDELCDFIVNNTQVEKSIERNPLTLISRLEELKKLKPIGNVDHVYSAFLILDNTFERFKGLNKKGQVLPIRLYCSALYLQLSRLSQMYDMSTAKTKRGSISGVSKNGFTKRDFMYRFTTGNRKRVWGNPYSRKEFVEGEGKTTRSLKKVSGRLEIEIPIDRKRGQELVSMIDSAGVSSFYLGKKGLAYVSKIRV